jgi:hypothetical protein
MFLADAVRRINRQTAAGILGAHDLRVISCMGFSSDTRTKEYWIELQLGMRKGSLILLGHKHKRVGSRGANKSPPYMAMSGESGRYDQGEDFKDDGVGVGICLSSRTSISPGRGEP